ncbi:hypothetical protein BDV95DRAFT_560515 [Massariosphaeria phaeospora]|uniref:Uncharacterized protein n=1 Tax=Massariosphaeria phaeospora TaxID=100035 RepID=A0A7C8MIJ8_9PLEO|nr:hypothetical protein BDV95DRAFT_560515 [Massariosphaeria phaeospora]
MTFPQCLTRAAHRRRRPRKAASFTGLFHMLPFAGGVTQRLSLRCAGRAAAGSAIPRMPTTHSYHRGAPASKTRWSSAKSSPCGVDCRPSRRPPVPAIGWPPVLRAAS